MTRVLQIWTSILWLFFSVNNNLFAQDSVLKQKLDSTKIESLKKLADNKSSEKQINYYQFITKNPIPKRSAMYSALLPGLGQAHNNQYWKIPIVYAGVGVSTYLLVTTFSNYQLYRKAFIIRTDNNPNTIDDLQQYDIGSLRALERSNRARLDRIVVYSAVYYGLNIIDALVSAHLKNFDVSKNISLQCQPLLMNNSIAGIGIGTTIKL